MDQPWKMAEPSPISSGPKVTLGNVVILIIGTS